MLVLMADIFPTGYFAAARYLKDLSPRDKKEYTVVCVGCGPVGICAITCALTMVDTVYAIDSVPERLEQAKALGAIPIHLNDNPVQKIKDATEGRGADVVMEVVGHADAWNMAFEMIRPWGAISSIGVHTEKWEVNGLLMYGKNVQMAFGRCKFPWARPISRHVMRGDAMAMACALTSDRRSREVYLRRIPQIIGPGAEESGFLVREDHEP